jgi:RNA polymerase sigma factor (sigma-70 family)
MSSSMEINPNLSAKGVYDYNLVKAAIEQGDQKAYAELMSRYKESVYFMLLKMVNNRDDADDLTIEAFAKAFKNLHQYTPNFAFSTWLFKIASNNCIDFIRKRRIKPFSTDKYFETEDGKKVMPDLISETHDPEEKMIRKQNALMVREVVDKLKPRYKRLIELRFFEEKSYEEIAKELDLPLGTVKAQLFRAREFLYELMRNIRHSR